MLVSFTPERIEEASDETSAGDEKEGSDPP
jgi:hypothetical protein